MMNEDGMLPWKSDEEAFDYYVEHRLRMEEPREPMFQATFTLKDWEREDPSVEGTWNPDSLDCFWLRSCGIDPL